MKVKVEESNSNIVGEKRFINIFKRAFDAYYEGNVPSSIYTSDLVAHNLTTFDCQPTTCYCIILEIDDYMLKSTKIFNSDSILKIFAEFGGLHAVMSFLISNILFFIIRLIYLIPKQTADVIVRPTKLE
jgi:hypothetical protein